jgi:hypothetical protein
MDLSVICLIGMKFILPCMVEVQKFNNLIRYFLENGCCTLHKSILKESCRIEACCWGWLVIKGSECFM